MNRKLMQTALVSILAGTSYYNERYMPYSKSIEGSPIYIPKRHKKKKKGGH